MDDTVAVVASSTWALDFDWMCDEVIEIWAVMEEVARVISENCFRSTDR